jgi:hypothetical protein
MVKLKVLLTAAATAASCSQSFRNGCVNINCDSSSSGGSRHQPLVN